MQQVLNAFLFSSGAYALIAGSQIRSIKTNDLCSLEYKNSI